MSPQTTYSDTLTVAIAGMPVDLNPSSLDGYYNGEATAEIPRGVFVKFGSATDKRKALLPTGGSDKLVGVVVYSTMHSRAYTAADGTVYGDLGATGLRPGAGFDVMKFGIIWVISETAAVPGDPVFVRIDYDVTEFGANGDLGLGYVRNAADESDCIDLTTKARYLDAVAAGGLTRIEFHLP